MMVAIRLGGAECFLAVDAMHNRASIYSLRTDLNHRNQGHAKRLVRAIRKWSDRNGIIVSLGVGPFGDTPMDAEQLITFYGKMGFKSMKHRYNMSYTPRKVTANASNTGLRILA